MATKIAKKKVAAKSRKTLDKTKVVRGRLGGMRMLDSVAKKADVLLKSIDSFKLKNPGTAGLPVLEKALKSVGKDVAKFKAAADKVSAKK